MAGYAKGQYRPKNPQKYAGKSPIVFRSSWELAVFRKLDEHPSVVAWGSESISVPYYNPLAKRWSFYIPDLWIQYVDRHGKYHTEIIEIKPMKESPLYEGRVSERTKLTQIVNAAKWQAAMVYCAKRRISFRVATEQDLFGGRRPGR